MSYLITRYNGQAITTVTDGTIDTSLDIKLIGKSYAGYGQAQNENFVYLLENFANTTQPPNPLSGQIWYDSGNNKIKFYDGTKFRTTGGAEVGASAPTGLTVGDFWFDTTNKQLFSWNGTSFTLIGPQGVAGAGTTQMQSVSVRDSLGGTHAIIQAINNGNVVFTISSDPDFLLDNTANAVSGFTYVRQGVTLVNTTNTIQPGVTTSSHRFYGTATNADKLGGLTAGSYVQAGNASFNSLVNFGDAGFTVGNPIPKLKIFNDGATTPTILNQINNTPIKFQTTTAASVTVTPMQLLNSDVLPGVTLASNLGSSGLLWNNIYASYVYSTAQKADTLNSNGVYVAASTTNITGAGSIVARDSAGTISVTYMSGVAEKADRLSYGNSYVSASATAVASTIVARDASANIVANAVTLTSIIKSGTAGTGDIGQSNNPFNNIYATTFTGNFAGAITGNTTGIHTGNIRAIDTTTCFDASTKTFSGNVNTSTGRLIVGTGSVTQPSITFSADTSLDTGFYHGGDGYINITNNGVYTGQFTPAHGLVVTGDMYATVFHGTATAANYADLAEKYLADTDYEVGTVMMIGGDKEITQCQVGSLAIGPVSANPAFKMNAELDGGTYIALKGRVPVKVTGSIIKGQRLVAGPDGTAQFATGNTADVFAVALESSNDVNVKLVECIIL
jgi:hypothetical protein